MRLFLALWPPDEVRNRLAAAGRAWGWTKRARCVPVDRLHLTLHFLGEVEEAAARTLVQRCPACPAFTLQLDRAEVWPPGLAVLEAAEVPPGLAALHAELTEMLRALGLRTEARRFRPHVTLARHAQGALPPESQAPVTWPVRGYALVRSHAGPPLRYETIAQVGEVRG